MSEDNEQRRMKCAFCGTEYTISDRWNPFADLRLSPMVYDTCADCCRKRPKQIVRAFLLGDWEASEKKESDFSDAEIGERQGPNALFLDFWRQCCLKFYGYDEGVERSGRRVLDDAVIAATIALFAPPEGT